MYSDDNIDTMGLEDLGLENQSQSHQGHGDESNARRELMDRIGIKEKQDDDSISSDDFKKFLAFQKAMKSKDAKELFKLAGMSSTDAFMSIPDLTADDHVSTLKNEIAQLKEQLNETVSWKQNQEKSLQEKSQQEKVQSARNRVNELLSREEFALINDYKQADIVWEAGRQFAAKQKRPPTRQEWLNMAVEVENSLREQARSIREKQMPLDKLDLQALLGQQEKPREQQQYQANRPTITNASSQEIAPSDDKSDLSREARIKRAMEAAKKFRN